jgi:hypothetical protein
MWRCRLASSESSVDGLMVPLLVPVRPGSHLEVLGRGIGPV